MEPSDRYGRSVAGHSCVGFDENRAGQTEQPGAVGNPPTTSVRRLILVSRSSGFADRIFFPVRPGTR